MASQWQSTIYDLIDVIVKIAGCFMAIGFTWSGLDVVIHSGIFGGSKIVPEVVFRALGLMFGFLLVFYSKEVTNLFVESFLAPIF